MQSLIRAFSALRMPISVLCACFVASVLLWCGAPTLAQPVLTLTKTASLTVVRPGDVITYTLSYRNSGDKAATGTLLADTLPAHLSYVNGSATNKPSYNTATQTLTWNLGVVPPGGLSVYYRITFKALVDSTAPLGQTLANYTTISCNEISSVVTSNTASVLVSAPAFTLTKTAAPTTSTPGGVVTFTVSYANTGTAAATNAILTDQLPLHLTAVNGSFSGGTYNPTTRALVWKLGTLAVNVSGSVAFKANIDTATTLGTVLTNNVSLTCSELSTPVTASAGVAVTHPLGGRSDWYLFHHDLKHSGRSPFIGPSIPKQRWVFTTGSGAYVDSSPSIAADGTIYVGSDDNNLYAVTPTGKAKWTTPFATGGIIKSTPAVGADGTIYVGSYDGNLYAVYPDGALKWSFAIGGQIQSSPTIGTDGTIYVGGSTSQNLYALNPDGTQKWAFATGGAIGYSSPAIGTDGTIYIGAQDGKLYAVNANGTARWTKPFATTGSITSSPAIAADGTIYIGSTDGKLYAITPYGTAKWAKACNLQGAITSSPAIGADGTVYVSSGNQQLSAINIYGTVKWQVALATGGEIDSSPAIGVNGLIFVASTDFNLYAFNPDGTTNWSMPISTQAQNWSSPAIGADGTLYVGSGDGQLYAINGQKPALTLTKSALPSSVAAGSTVTFTLSYANTSAFPATNTVLTDPLPSYLTYVTGSSSNSPSYDAPSNTLTWKLGTLPASGNSVSYRITFKALLAPTTPGNAQLINTAGIICDDMTAPLYSDSTVTVYVTPKPVLALAQSASPARVRPNNSVTYSITCRNSGNLGTSNVMLTEVLPAQITYVAGSATGGATYNTGARTLTWSLGTLNVGANPVTLTFKVTVSSAVLDGSTITTNATLTGTGAATVTNKVLLTVSAPTISAWWMFHHDAQRTGRFSNVGIDVMGPTIAKLKWTYAVPGYGEDTPCVGTDGTVYIGSTDDNLYAINPDGTKKWAFATKGAIRSSPALAADGTIYVGSSDGNMYAINPDGSKKWAFSGTGSSSYYYGGYEYSSPAIAPDGTIYIGSLDSNVYAVNPDGTKKWAFPTGSEIGTASPAIAYDGTIYAGSYDNNLYAINPDGTQKWAFATNGLLESSPVIASDNTIYTADDNLFYCVNPDGTMKWSASTGVDIDAGPAVGPDATIYIGSCDDQMYAVNPDGSTRWTFPCNDQIESSPVFGADGTIYFGSYDNNVYALHPDGTKLWSYTTGGMVDLSSPALGPDGTLYISSADGKLYAFSGGAPQPAFRFNKTASATQAQHGDTVTYTIMYRNVGNLAATNALLTDVVPAHMTYVQGSVTGGGVFNAANSTITWTLGTLNAGSTVNVQVTFQATVNSDAVIGANISNSALISCTELATPVTSNLATFAVYTPLPALTLHKTASPSPAKRGDKITYTLSYQNNGTLAASNTALLDVLPAHITYVQGSATSGGTYNAANGALTWSLGTLNIGATAQVTFQVTVNNDAAFWSYIDNSAIIGCTELSTPVFSNVAGFTVIDPSNTTVPWPMCQHDPQHTGRSPITGPGTPKKHWAFATKSYISAASPAIAMDGTLYIGSRDDNLYALNMDGTQKWVFKTNNSIYSTPAIGADGTIYLGAYDGNLYAIKPDGTKKWSYPISYDAYSSPVIGTDGTIYIASDQLYAINPNGTKKWTCAIGSYGSYSSPALAADGTIYVASYDGYLYAIKPSGTQSWKFATTSSYIDYSSPTVAADGTIYLGGDMLYAVKPDGTKKWTYTTSGTLYCTPALAADGTVYLGDMNGHIYALNADGSKKWDTYAGYAVYDSSPIIGGDGVIYIGADDSNIYAFNADGTKKWTYAVGTGSLNSPALGIDGALYLGSSDAHVYAIGN